MTPTEWKTKEEKVQQDLFWELGPETGDRRTRFECRTRPDNLKLDKLLRKYNRYFFYRKETITNHDEIFFR